MGGRALYPRAGFRQVFRGEPANETGGAIHDDVALTGDLDMGLLNPLLEAGGRHVTGAVAIDTRVTGAAATGELAKGAPATGELAKGAPATGAATAIKTANRTGTRLFLIVRPQSL